MSGVRLTIPRLLQEGRPVKVMLHLPAESIDNYAKQAPLELLSKLCWQRKEGDRLRCGLQFESLGTEQRRGIERVFEFYKVNPEYVEARA